MPHWEFIIFNIFKNEKISWENDRIRYEVNDDRIRYYQDNRRYFENDDRIRYEVNDDKIEYIERIMRMR